MKRKTVVSICDMDFTFVGEESEEYVQKIAALVDQRMREVTEGSKVSTLNAAILTAANIADDYFKALQLVEDSKVQVRSYFEEISKLKDENDRLRRAGRSGSAAPRRSRRGITGETPLVSMSAVTEQEPAPAEEVPAEPAAEPEVMLVMDSEIEAAESEPVEPSEEEAEQLKFDK